MMKTWTEEYPGGSLFEYKAAINYMEEAGWAVRQIVALPQGRKVGEMESHSSSLLVVYERG